MKKKGEETVSAGGLVIVLAFLIIFYILFLPQEAREELLGTGPGGSGSVAAQPQKAAPSSINKTIFVASPGRIDYAALDKFEYNIPSFTLYATKGAEEIEAINNFYIRNAWFDKKTKTEGFTIRDLENTDNVKLSFVAKVHKGILQIRLNGEQIYENRIATTNPEPISLKKANLKENNDLEFSVTGVGLRFWQTNEYGLENVKITADVTDVSRQQSKNVFYITEKEGENIEKATLRFAPGCKPAQAGILTVDINDWEVFSGIADCGNVNIYRLSPSQLNIGKNKVVFNTEKGSYLIDRIQVKTELKEPVQPTYYFEMDDKLFASQKDEEEECGKIDGVCPKNCDEDVDKDCCFEKYSTAYWCDSLTSNIDDRCVGYVEASQCSRCLAGYEDEGGEPADACEGRCGDDTDNSCPAGCSIYYDKDCCFDQAGDQYWCNEMPLNGISYACANEVSAGQCQACQTGYKGEESNPSCPKEETEGEEEEKLKKDYDVKLTFEFTDDIETKEAQLYINGRRVSFTTRASKWEKNIDEYLVSGTNSIKIVPKSVLDIRELKVELED